ncbi:MAG: carboxypeptidase-like regulatory domain-containing protein [Planctomycetaceae bacterium]|nr:carboxypeptidase-like regulatory domain-containing protein [Planctomycetaceae bacterium]
MKLSVVCRLLSAVFFPCLLSFSGCGGGQAVPPGFPAKLTSVTITLQNSGQPVHEAAVSLIAEPPEPYLVSAITNTAGTAKPQTIINAFSREGVPPGTYKVLIKNQMKSTVPELRPEDATDSAKEAEYQAKVEKERAEQQKQSGISPDWSDIKKTPFKLTIPNEAKSITIEFSDTKTFEQ